MAVAERGPLSISDARGGDATLRVTWHAPQRKVVLSHWHGPVCTASSAIEVEKVPQLVSSLVAALGQAAVSQTPEAQMSDPTTRLSRLLEHGRSLLHRVRRDLALVVPISSAADRTRDRSSD